MLKISPNTTGGTDVKCVFDYLSGRVPFQGKKQETKMTDISCVLIITDGCFSTNYGEYSKYFNKKTVWLIDGAVVTFNSLFGKVVSMIDDKSRHGY